MNNEKYIKTKNTSLREFIDLIGRNTAATLFEVPVNSIKSYYYGYRQPSIKVAKRMMKVTGGKLNFESIYGPIEESVSV